MRKDGKALILDAYVQLLLEHPDADFLVKEVCSKAGVHRSTFYSHFKCVDDVGLFLMDSLMDGYDTYCESLEDLFGFGEAGRAASDAPPIVHGNDVLLMSLKANDFIFEHRDACVALLRSKLGAELRSRIIDSTTNLMLRLGTVASVRSDSGRDLTKVETRYMLYRVAYDAVAMLDCWVDRSFEESPEEFLRISQLVIGLFPNLRWNQ